jgi:hypothetical protein
MDKSSATFIEGDEAQVIKLGGWSVFVFLLLFALGWGVLGRNIPPYNPSLTAEQIAVVFRTAPPCGSGWLLAHSRRPS